MYKVDSNIPVPATKQWREPKYPFAKMEVGDSFCVPVESRRGETMQQVKNRMLGACAWAKRKSAGSATPRRFIVRAEEDADNLGIRVWRVE